MTNKIRFSLMILLVFLVGGLGFAGYKLRGAWDAIKFLEADNKSLQLAADVYGRLHIETNERVSAHALTIRSHEIAAKTLTDNYLKVIHDATDPCLDSPAPPDFVRLFMAPPLD